MPRRGERRIISSAIAMASAASAKSAKSASEIGVDIEEVKGRGMPSGGEVEGRRSEPSPRHSSRACLEHEEALACGHGGAFRDGPDARSEDAAPRNVRHPPGRTDHGGRHVSWNGQSKVRVEHGESSPLLARSPVGGAAVRGIRTREREDRTSSLRALRADRGLGTGTFGAGGAEKGTFITFSGPIRDITARSAYLPRPAWQIASP